VVFDNGKKVIDGFDQKAISQTLKSLRITSKNRK